MVPITVVTAYFLVVFIYRWKRDAVRILAAVLAVACIAVSGERIYSSATFTKAQNEYKLPQAAIEVADVIAAAGVDWKAKAVVPNELLCYIRQYRCDIGLFYGRNAGGFISEIGEDEQKVYEQMCSPNPDVSVITELGKKNEVTFLCFNTSTQEIPEDLSGYGYQLYRVAGDYSIYILETKMFWKAEETAAQSGISNSDKK